MPFPSPARSRTRRRSARRLVAAVEACEPRRLLASVSGVVYQDLNKNGARDAGENGLSGITVYADKNFNGARDAGELSAVTAGDGSYAINGILADGKSNAIRLLNLPGGATITAPAGGGHSAKFASDYHAGNRNFGVATTTAAPTGRVVFRPYWDRNGSGGLDPADQVFVEGTAFIDLNDDYVRQEGEPALHATPSAPGGGLPGYVSGELAPGTYRVIYTPASYTPGAGGGVPVVTVTVVAGATPTPADLKLPATQRPYAEAEEYAIVRPFRDADGDGEYDAGEVIPTDAILWLEFDRDNVRDADEPLLVYNPASKSYDVGIPSPESPRFAVRLAGDADLVADATLDRGYSPAGYAREEYIAMPAATPAPAATVNGTVYNDADKDGTRDAGEAGVGGKAVYGDLNYNGVKEANEPTALTDANGFYTLSIPVGPNSVAIRLVPEAGVTVTAPASGMHSGKFTSAYTAGNRNFGVATTAQPTTGSILFEPFLDTYEDGVRWGEPIVAGGTAWLDLNGSGLREANEPLLVETTAGYTLSNVAPGTYTIAFRRPADTDAYGDYNDTAHVVAGQQTLVRRAVRTTSTIEGIVFQDNDGDGVRDAGDAGVPDLTVFADYNYDGALNGNEPWARTFSDGTYRLSGVRSDNVQFWLTLVNPAGTAITKPSGADGTVYKGRFDRSYDVTGRDFGFRTVPSTTTTVINGYVFDDRDEDGAYDDFEGRHVSNATVFADYDNNGTRSADEPIAVFDSAGNYALTTKRATFTVRLTSATLAQTAPTNNAGIVVNATSGATVNDVAFGATFRRAKPARLFVSARLDLNRDGTLQPDERYEDNGTYYGAAWIDADKDGVFDEGEPEIRPTRTDDYVDERKGDFFIDLDPGTYTIAFARGTSSGVEAGVGAVAEVSRTLTFGSTQSTTFVALPLKPLTAGVSGFVFSDVNGDGIRQDGEPGVTSNVFVDLDDDGVRDNNEPLAVTDGYGGLPARGERLPGAYYLGGLTPGTYVIAKANYDPVTMTQRPTTRYVVTLAAGQTRLNLDFANIARPAGAIVAGTVFNDLNKNGVRDVGEGGIAGKTIFGDYDHDGVLDGNEPSTTTDAQGRYYLTRIAADVSVGVRILNQPAGSVTSPAGGAYWATYASSDDRRGRDFGVIV